VLLTTAQAAKKLKVSARRVIALIEAGRLPATKLGQIWVVEEKDLKIVRDRKPGRPKA
jgi:excisionase family DNA binding protein